MAGAAAPLPNRPSAGLDLPSRGRLGAAAETKSAPVGALGSSNPGAETLGPAAVAGAVEEVGADGLHLLHRPGPARADVIGIIMRGVADLLDPDVAVGDLRGDAL